MRGASCLLIAAAVLTLGVSVAGQTVRTSLEQTHFSAEDAGVKHPVPLPSQVVEILRRDELVRDVLENRNMTPDNLPASWFSASEITLGSLGEKDLIVAAEGPLVGGNVDTYWVFIRKDKGYVLVLTIPTHDLIVKSSRFGGYRNLEVLAATASTVTTVYLRFDGRQYREYSAKTEDIK